MSLPAALDYLYTSKEEIEDTLSVNGVLLRLDDDESATLSVGELTRINSNAINYGTSRVNMFIGSRYAADQMVNSWTVHNWATTIAAVWICRRRGNPVPKSLMSDYKSAMLEMQSVHDRELGLNDIYEMQGSQPVLTNYRLDDRYDVRKLRRERSISTPIPVRFQQSNDYADGVIGPMEFYP